MAVIVVKVIADRGTTWDGSNFYWWLHPKASSHASFREAMVFFKQFERGQINHLPTLPASTGASSKGVARWL